MAGPYECLPLTQDRSEPDGVDQQARYPCVGR